MVWLSASERVTLSVLGACALAGAGVHLWMRQRAPLRAELDPAEHARWDAALAQSAIVDLNTAGPHELERLPEIGPATAQRIVAYRTVHGAFQRTEDLQRVPGIGPKTFDAIDELVTVR